MGLFDFFVSSTRLPSPDAGPIGLLAGAGRMPLLTAQGIKDRDYDFVTVALERGADSKLTELTQDYLDIPISEGQRALDFLTRHGVRHLVMAGKVFKPRIYARDFNPDSVTSRTLFSAGRAKGDNRIMRSVENLLRLNGIRVLDPSLFLTDAITPKGLLSKRAPSKDELSDIQLGTKIARTLGRLDVGHTVVVRDGSVLAVEAMEGTDRAIERVSELKVEGAVVIKVAKPQQRLSLDPPVLGTTTVETAHRAACRVIAAQHNRTLMLDRPDMIALADQYDMTLIGI